MGAPPGPSSFLGTAAISPWEGGGHILDCVQGPCANVLQCGHWWERIWSMSRCPEDLWHHVSMLRGAVLASAGLHDDWAAAEASPGCFI